MLTSEQLSAFRNDGFLVLPDFVSRAACDLLSARARELVEEFNPAEVLSVFSTREQNRLTDDYFLNSGDKIRFFFEENAFGPEGTLLCEKNRAINKIGHNLHELDRTFSDFSRTQALQELVADLGIVEPLLLQSMFIFKQPQIGGEVISHQDSTFLYTEPQELIGLWFALEDATLENGCLWAIPGGHKFGLKFRWLRTAEGMKFESFNCKEWPEESSVPLEVRQGTLIVLDGLLPHKSETNRSEKSRHAYTLHVISASTHYPASNWLQRPENMPLRGF